MIKADYRTIVKVKDPSTGHRSSAQLLREAGYRVIEASTNEEACSVAEREGSALLLLREQDAEEFRVLADHAPALLWVNGPDGCQFVNRAYVTFLGVTAAEVRRFDWAEFVHPDDRSIYLTAYLEAATKRRLFEATFRFRRHDGVYRLMKSVGVPRFTEDGSYLGYVGSTIDVTDVRHSEMTQGDRPTHQAGPTRNEEARPKWRALKEYGVALGATLVALLIRLALDPYLGDHLPYVTFFIAVTVTTSYGGLGPSFMALLLGGLLSNWFFMSPRGALYLHDVMHQVGYAGYFAVTLTFVILGQALQRTRRKAESTAEQLQREAAERRRVEGEVRESEERLRLVLEAADLGSWDVDVRTGHAVWNRRHAIIQGYRTDEGPVTMDRWRQWMHPDDLARIEAAIEHAKRNHERLAEEHRIILPDTGEVRWLSLYGRFSYDKAGTPVRFSGVSMDITDRKQTEVAVAEGQRTLKTVTDNASLALFIMDARQQCVFMNPAAQELTGYTLAEAQGRPLHDVVHHTRPDGRPYPLTECPIDQAFPKQNRMQGEEVFVHKDGHFYTVAFTASPIKNTAGTPVGTIIEVQDISDRKRAEESLRASESFYRQTLESIPGMVFTNQPDGPCDYVSQQWVDFTGIPASEQLGSGWVQVLHPDDRERAFAAWRSAVEGQGRYDLEYRVRRHDGEYEWFKVWGHAIRTDTGAIIRWFGTAVNVNDLKLAEESLRRWKEGLEVRVRERTQDLQQSQERLRTLASELNLAEQRERKRLAAELHDHLQQTLVLGKLKLGAGKRFAVGLPAIEKIMKETDDVFSEALAYTRTLVAELSPPVLREHGLVAGLKWLAEYMKKHEQTVAVTVPEQMDFKLPEDQVILLFQSVRELLINSSKHAGIGEATVTMEQRDGSVSIMVSDKGNGFDLAAAAAAAGTPNGGISSKFGLFSVEERMRALGGSFDIQSSPGQGTTATLTLPLGGGAAVRTEVSGLRTELSGTLNHQLSEAGSFLDRSNLSPRHSVPSPQPSALSSIRVLLVDDHAMVRQGLRAVLDAYADLHVVGEAQDGAEAVKLAEELGPQVVVMDINMPRMNGIEATTQIKARWPDTRVIGISVNTGDGNSDAMKRAGAAIVLPKDTAVDQLHDAISGLCQHPVSS